MRRACTLLSFIGFIAETILVGNSELFSVDDFKLLSTFDFFKYSVWVFDYVNVVSC